MSADLQCNSAVTDKKPLESSGRQEVDTAVQYSVSSPQSLPLVRVRALHRRRRGRDRDFLATADRLGSS